MSGRVASVSSRLDFEQEIAHFDVDIDKRYSYTDVGLKLNEVTNISLTSSDKDGDLVRCRKAENVERGRLDLVPNVMVLPREPQRKHCPKCSRNKG
nr:hypothetical protein BaRGS_023881 [Batillaria attramentaria]